MARPRIKQILMPEWLTGEAAENWRQMVADMPKSKLRAIDQGVLATYCVSLAQYAECQRGIDKYGLMVVKCDENGELVDATLSPWAKHQKVAASQIKAFAAEIGLSPRGRKTIEGVSAAKSMVSASPDEPTDMEKILAMDDYRPSGKPF